ncbi:MAG TPA: hypothetical protein PL117_01155 [Accumulibacter sp.]|uniref:hypothetical protein n=1 Tax=Accumulibacter sp. TaxID=2053492 RepID=UPI002CB0EF4F|nr:hypothetical protein [Accumulibacter sp.]HRF71356.1 hypothetical protein [Accumulibacter sp.]
MQIKDFRNGAKQPQPKIIRKNRPDKPLATGLNKKKLPEYQEKTRSIGTGTRHAVGVYSVLLKSCITDR